MTDIVERLRTMAVAIHIVVEKPVADDIADGLTKAADEIERLLAENAALAADKVEERANRYWEGRYRDEAADNDRLREEFDRLNRAYDQLREIYMNTVAR